MGLISPEWTTNDQTTAAFYDRLYRSLSEAPNNFIAFRSQCQARERAGREKFGHRHLGRDNIEDLTEEAADGANYFLFDHLQQLRRHERDDDLGLVLTGAHHFYLAHQIGWQLRARRQGAP